MRKRNLKLLLLSAAVLLTGCVYDRDGETVDPSGSGRLVININSSSVGSGTRATVINDGSSSTNSAAEKTVSTMAIAIFSSDGATKKDYKYLTNLNGTTEWSTVTEHTNLVNAMAAGDIALVAVNVKATVAASLQTAATATAFRAVMSSIDQTLIFADTYAGGETVDPAKLPMYGSGTLAAAGDNASNFEVTVNVMHMVSKVTLNSLTLTAGANDQFTPTAIFLINVPEQLDFTFTADGDEANYGFNGVGTNFFQGESAAVASSTAVTTGGLTTRQFRDYLGTGALTEAALTNANTTMATTYTFYTMPNNDNTEDTRLVIAGNWSDNGGTSSTAVWYTIQLNNVADNGTLSTNIYPNRHYKVDLELKRSGALIEADDATGAYNSPTTQQAVRATVTVSDWNDGSMTTTFGGNGSNPSES